MSLKQICLKQYKINVDKINFYVWHTVLLMWQLRKAINNMCFILGLHSKANALPTNSVHTYFIYHNYVLYSDILLHNNSVALLCACLEMLEIQPQAYIILKLTTSVPIIGQNKIRLINSLQPYLN